MSSKGPVAVLATAVAQALDERLDQLGAGELGERVAELHRVAQQVQAAVLDSVAELDRRHGSEPAGERATRDWVHRHTGLHAAAVGETMRTARALRDHLPDTRAALRSGRITARHASAIARVAEKVGEGEAGAAEGFLVGVAERGDPAGVHRAGQRLFQWLHPAGAESELGRRIERRRLDLRVAEDGMGFLDGVLDPESTELVMAALMPLMSPAGPDDERKAPQRRLDALAEMARITLDSGRLAGSGGERPHVSVVVDEASLAAASAGAGLSWSGAELPAEHARRLVCDATLIPIVAKRLRGATWLPLQVGRAARLASPAQLRALRLRDDGCIWPGCGRRPDWCDAHHVRHWADGGPTDLANLVLLCRHHHRQVHHADVRVLTDPRRPGLFRLSHPDGRVLPAQHAGDRAPPDRQAPAA